MRSNKNCLEGLPSVARDYIESVIKAMGYRRKVRQEVCCELADHFGEALRDCGEGEREERARELIAEFGDAKLLAALIRRGKKRCRPLWKKSLICVFKVIGIILLLVGMRIGFLSVGRVNVSVDYVQWLNDLSSQGRDEKLNARADYLRAVKLYKNELLEEFKEGFPRLSEDLSEDQYLLAKEFLRSNEECLKAMAEGAGKPYYWPEYSGQMKHESRMSGLPSFMMEIMPSLMTERMDPLLEYKRIAQCMVFRIALEIHDGEIESAMDDAFVLLEFGVDMQGKGLFIEQLVGIAFEAMAIESLYEIAGLEAITVEQIKKLHARVKPYFDYDRIDYGLEAEKAFWYDEIQRRFTDDGKGGGRVLIKGLPFAVSGWRSALGDFVLCDFPDRREVISEIDRQFESIRKYYQRRPFERNEEDRYDMSNTFFMLQISLPAYESNSKLLWRSKANEAGLVVAVSVIRYEMEKGVYPESLEDVVKAGYLDEVPEDPFSGGSLIYERRGEGFVVYSVGENFVDDGGVVTRNKRGRVNKWKNNDDFILWPVM